MNMCKYSLSKIRQQIREYNLKQILDSGENDMIDEHIDKNAVENILLQNETQREEEKKPTVDLNKTLNDIQESDFFEDIINLKNKNKNVE